MLQSFNFSILNSSSILLLLSSFFISCKSPSESSRSTHSQTQSISSLSTQTASQCRLTALSIDSVTLQFIPPTRSLAGQAAQPTDTSPHKAAKRPATIHIYGLSASREESTQTAKLAQRTDSSATSQQSATDKSHAPTKATPSTYGWLTLIPITLMAAAILFLTVKLKR